jgi:hypothetical protein
MINEHQTAAPSEHTVERGVGKNNPKVAQGWMISANPGLLNAEESLQNRSPNSLHPVQHGVKTASHQTAKVE